MLCEKCYSGYKLATEILKIQRKLIILEKSNDRKVWKYAICHKRIFQPNREGGRTVGSGRVASIIE